MSYDRLEQILEAAVAVTVLMVLGHIILNWSM